MNASKKYYCQNESLKFRSSPYRQSANRHGQIKSTNDIAYKDKQKKRLFNSTLLESEVRKNATLSGKISIFLKGLLGKIESDVIKVIIFFYS